MGKPGKLLCTVQAFGWLSATGLAFADHSRAPGKRTGATFESNVMLDLMHLPSMGW
jgi:hypothetical protein